MAERILNLYHHMEMKGQIHVAIALLSGKQSPVTTG